MSFAGEPDGEIRGGGCHCGTVRFRVRLREGLTRVARCTCSICRMRGAVTVGVPEDDFAVEQGADRLVSYLFNTGEAQHRSCGHCGIHTHHHRRFVPGSVGVNVACLDGVSPFDFAQVPVVDGVNHPNDVGGRFRRAGTLRFDPASSPSPTPQDPIP